MLTVPAVIFAQQEGDGHLAVVSELQPYYSSIALYAHPHDDEFPYVDSDNELEIYGDLFLRSYAPRDIGLEASVYPVPVLGVMVKKHSPDFYEDMQWETDFNLIHSMTQGFDEPYALSLFLGNVVKYRSEDLSMVGKNKGFMGYLISGGAHHIKDNTLIDDNWGEFEWKLKGDRETETGNLSWSFRIGGKWHENDDIADVYYLGLRRNHLDFNAPVISWLFNSGVDYEIAFDQADGSLVEQRLFLGKKLPIRALGLAFELQVGLIERKGAKYRGELAQVDEGEGLFLVLQPQIEF